jgi:hypothetical protein
MNGNRKRRWWVAAVLLACAGGAAGAGAEEFYLRAAHTNRVFGPFRYEQGATVTVGRVAFELVRRPAPAEPAAPEVPPEMAQAARAAADTWLALIDQDAFGAAWDQSADYLKTALARDEFAKSLRAVRDTLGSLRSRRLASLQHTDSLPSAPDAHYVIIQYDVEMERKRHAVETIIPMCATDGCWRISGYYVR